MLKKIILPLVILIFAHEELYGMKTNTNKQQENENSEESNKKKANEAQKDGNLETTG